MGRPFDTKRRFKRSMKIILTLFVSFLVSISCGIPSYFYMQEGSDTSSSYYVFTEGDDDSTYIDTFDLEFAIDLAGETNSSVTSVEGPSLILLYTIVPEDVINTGISDITSKFKTQFSSEYINGNTGKAISSNEDEVLSIDYDSETYTMYKFQIYNSSTGELINLQTPTEYGLEFDTTITSNSTYNSDFGFQYVETSDDEFQILLSKTDTESYSFPASGDVITSLLDLKTYDNDYFLQRWDNSDSGHDKITSGSTYYVVIYTALNVSDGDGFTNIFWSTLNEVGIIPSDGTL